MFDCYTIKVPIFSTFCRNQVLHSVFFFLTWQLRNIDVAGVCGRPQHFVVDGFVKPSYCLLKRGPESLFLVSFQYLGPWASWKVRKPYLYIKSKNNVGQLSSTFPYLTSISHFLWLITEINNGSRSQNNTWSSKKWPYEAQTRKVEESWPTLFLDFMYG